MKTERFHEALGEVDDKYIDKAMSYEPKKRNRIFMVTVSAAACLFAAVCAAATFSVPSRKAPEAGVIAEKSTQTVQPSQTVQSTAAAETQAAPKELYYSELVTADKEYDIDYPSEPTVISLDIDAFDDTKLKECPAVVEGEVVDIYSKKYEYDTACSKFEHTDTIHRITESVVYKIKVEKVLYGDASVGDIITVEDEFFLLDSFISVNKGGRYVIPIYYAGEVFYEDGGVVSGNNKRESVNCTYDPFIPQIKAVEGGYIVPDSWKHLITDDCTKVIVDEAVSDSSGEYFKDKMYFVPEEVFETQMAFLLAE